MLELLTDFRSCFRNSSLGNEYQGYSMVSRMPLHIILWEEISVNMITLNKCKYTWKLFTFALVHIFNKYKIMLDAHKIIVYQLSLFRSPSMFQPLPTTSIYQVGSILSAKRGGCTIDLIITLWSYLHGLHVVWTFNPLMWNYADFLWLQTQCKYVPHA